MALGPKIQTFTRVIPMIYAYTTPGITYHEGWTKIGYTEKQTVEDRIKQQTHTAHVRWELAWKANAMYDDGSQEYFTDHDFHRYLEKKLNVPREKDTEWFQIDGKTSKAYFNDFRDRVEPQLPVTQLEYHLREEQARAVAQTKAYFENGGTEFLWNAKPRFGKTLTTYDLIQTMGFKKVLVVTNRPSIANSWSEDFNKFVGWHGSYVFVSETESLAGKPGVLSRDQFITKLEDNDSLGMVAFESLQGLKGSVYFGGQFNKLQWIADNEFDLLVIDEAQEGIDTIKTEHAFERIKRKHTLYLSGTPFKALANGQFNEDQIFNWSYADEQRAKEEWQGEAYNPYESLPRLALYTYRMSDILADELSKGKPMMDDEDPMAYAFDLSEFFSVNDSGKFIHEADVRRFLHTLVTNEKYPFSTPELREELSHTLWILNYVDSAKAMAKLLADPEFADIFGDYKVVLAAGDGRLSDEDTAKKSFDRVKDAIANNEKTITLSVGQLTVGVTVPEWSGVLMLCNLKSPSSYMQAAFRAQNPCKIKKNGQVLAKETAYVFDFDPARTLIIYDEFANNLSPHFSLGGGTSEKRADNIKELLNFFPVIAEDEGGHMVELDAAKVLSIPRKLKCEDVVRRGFMSNYLFQNIGNVFGAPAVIQGILKKLTPVEEGTNAHASSEPLPTGEDLHLDEDGNIDIPSDIVIGTAQAIFGNKEYDVITDELNDKYSSALSSFEENLDKQSIAPTVKKQLSTVSKHLEMYVKESTEITKSHVVDTIMTAFDGSSKEKKSLEKSITKYVDTKIQTDFDRIKRNYENDLLVAVQQKDDAEKLATSESDIQRVQIDFSEKMQQLHTDLITNLQNTAKQIAVDTPKDVVEKVERFKEEKEKRSLEDKYRACLRGFSRAIPSFIMAYADACPDKELTLATFDDFTDDDVFLEVTGITEEEFRLLRDGGTYTNPDTGEIEEFKGHLFDEVVFNDSIKEFLRKKDELSNYFDESQTEDIFDYIPPQKTNQIFTPRWVVKKMVDELEANNPGCFDNPEYTFADLYMKSGLYITEIVKRLYKSTGLKAAFPDDKERIRHIFTKQVYGMAPTAIIHLIATNYILGFDKELKKEITQGDTLHFVHADAAEASKAGTLEELVSKYFG